MAPPALDRLPAIDLLADGEWHSGVALGRALGLSRAAIWKQVRALRALGLTIVADRGLGYRLGAPLDLLNGAAIQAAMGPPASAALERLEVHFVTSSTNECLAGVPAPAPGLMRAVVAEYQTGGRGSRGRRWFSPLGHGVCLSVAWGFETAPRDLPALSLVAGISVAGALADLGVQGVQLKWPNDIVAAGGKVGGILVEVAGESGGPLRTVIGIGLNVRSVAGISAALQAEGGAMPARALDDLLNGPRLPRNLLVGRLLDALHDGLRRFGDGGFRPFLALWRERDCLVGESVVVSRGGESFTGLARGLADDGTLLVEREGAIVPVVAGDVTLRAPG